MKGRKPIPTAMKLLAGNPGKRPLNSAEPKPRAGKVTPPKHLDKTAAAEWRRVAPDLTAMNLLTPVDRAAFAIYCDAWATYLLAHDALTKESPVLHGENGSYQNPWVAILKGAKETIHKFACEFGMTPSSRTRVKAPSTNDERADLESFLFSHPN